VAPHRAESRRPPRLSAPHGLPAPTSGATCVCSPRCPPRTPLDRTPRHARALRVPPPLVQHASHRHTEAFIDS
jgi:hypothetical protein